MILNAKRNYHYSTPPLIARGQCPLHKKHIFGELKFNNFMPFIIFFYKFSLFTKEKWVGTIFLRRQKDTPATPKPTLDFLGHIFASNMYTIGNMVEKPQNSKFIAGWRDSKYFSLAFFPSLLSFFPSFFL